MTYDAVQSLLARFHDASPRRAIALARAEDPEVVRAIVDELACEAELDRAAELELQLALEMLETQSRPELDVDDDDWEPDGEEEDDADDDEDDDLEPASWIGDGLLDAILVLAARRERPALEPVLSVCCLPEREAEEIFEGMRPEVLGAVIASLARGCMAPIRRAIDRPETHDPVRAALLEGLAIMVVEDDLSRAQLAIYLLELFQTRRIPEGHTQSWIQLCEIVVELGIDWLRGPMIEAADAGLCGEWDLMYGLRCLKAADGVIPRCTRKELGYLDATLLLEAQVERAAAAHDLCPWG